MLGCDAVMMAIKILGLAAPNLNRPIPFACRFDLFLAFSRF